MLLIVERNVVFPWTTLCVYCSIILNRNLLGSCVGFMETHKPNKFTCSHLEWLHSSVGKRTAPASPRSWVRIPLKTPEIFHMHRWDNCWDFPASVRIISSIHSSLCLKKFMQASYCRSSIFYTFIHWSFFDQLPKRLFVIFHTVLIICIS